MRGSQIFQEIHSIANTAALTVQLCRPPLRGFDCALQIRTRNVNLDHICLCHSVSYYEPAAADPTRNTQYYMAVSPNEDCLPRPSGGERGGSESLCRGGESPSVVECSLRPRVV